MDLRLGISFLLYVMVFGLALAPVLGHRRLPAHRWKWVCALFLGVLAAAFVAWRWRSLSYNGEVNVDESQLLSQAMRYRLDPIPWRSVDGGSSGPLNTWVVLWAPLVGLKLDYLAARITSVLCFWSMFVGLALALREMVGRRWALLLLLPAATFLLLTTNLDFAFFSSEQLPAALMAWVVYLLAVQLRSPSPWPAYGIGLLTGALPFCKIQVGPLGVLLYIIAAGAVIWARGGWRPAARTLLLQAAGGLTVPLLILIPVALGGAWGDFFEFYIRTYLGYKNKTAALPMLSATDFIFGEKVFGSLATVHLVVAGFALVYDMVRGLPVLRESRNQAVLGASFVFLGLAVWSVLRSGYPFPHYLMLLIVPGVVFLAASFRCYAQDGVGGEGSGEEAARAGEQWVITGVCGVFLIQILSSVGGLQQNKQLLANWGSGLHPMGEVIKSQIQPGDTIVIWGWAPKFNVMSQTPPAVRFSQSMFLLDPATTDEAKKPFLARFMDDLRKSRPRLFIDAPDEFMWPSYPHGSAGRHFAVPEVSEFVRANYTAIGTVPSPPGKAPILVYRRKD